MQARIRWAVSGAVVAVVAAAAAFGVPPTAVATQGQAILAGTVNTQTSGTLVKNTDYPAPGCPTVIASGGLIGCGQSGVDGIGSVYGVTAVGPDVGVIAESDSTGVRGFGHTIGVEGVTSTGTGVSGWNNGATGIGVKGSTGGTGTGVYGLADSNGVGVFGDTTNGTGVQARSTNGNALRVLGKAQFSRSGLAIINGTPSSPKSFVVITNVSLTGKSLVLTTSQRPVSGVYILGAGRNAPASTVTIRLNQAVTVSYPVAWFIVEMP